MLDINLVRETPEVVVNALHNRQMESASVYEIQELDKKRRALLAQAEDLKAERNSVSKEIGKSKDSQERQQKIESMRQVGDKIAALDEEITLTETQLNDLISKIPNIPDASVPYGKSEENNIVVKTVGKPKEFSFQPLPHWELAPNLGILNFEQGVKLSGSRFYVLSGAGARLQRALIAWMLDLHQKQGYYEKYTPFMVKQETMFASGQLPKFYDNLYHDDTDDFWFVPTAEVPLTGIHIGDIFEENQLPRRYTAYTPCFRREKMSAGRDIRGIKRGHQFDKVEMYTYALPEHSQQELERMLDNAVEVCEKLKLPYRILQLCTGDLGFNATQTFDVEVWAPGCNEWLEVSSVSNVGDFQARRANIKYRPTDGSKPRCVHTLNGSGLGMPRTLISVLETYQQEDGSVVVPEVLLPWMGGTDIIYPEQP